MLELDGVGFRYGRGDWVLRDVSLAVLPGRAAAVLGPNGRGKTTLARVAAGRLSPLEGAVRRSEPAAFVPQSRGSAFAYPAFDMVLMGRAGQIPAFSTPGRRDREAARLAMEQVGIAHLAQRPFPTLSGGEQQLVLIARALASRSRLLVLDEPAAGLDLANQARVLTLLKHLLDDGLALVLTTHHPDHALYLDGDAVLLDGTGGAESGPAASLLTDELLTRLYGIPVCTVTYADAGGRHRAVLPRYEAAPGWGDPVRGPVRGPR